MNGFDAYTCLLLHFPPRPIASETAYWETQAVIDSLLAQETLTAAEQDYLSLLGILIENYDEAQQVFPELRGVALLKALIEELDIQPAALLPIFRTDTILSAILTGRRKLSIEQVEGLSRFFQLPPSVFFEEAETDVQEHSYRPLEPLVREVMVKV